MAIIPAYNRHSLRLRLGSCRVSLVEEVRQTPHVHMVYIRLLTVAPIALGALSMALVLWQPREYYYYCAISLPYSNHWTFF